MQYVQEATSSRSTCLGINCWIPLCDLYFLSHDEFRWDIRFGSVPNGYCPSNSGLYARIHGVRFPSNLVSCEILVKA